MAAPSWEPGSKQQRLHQHSETLGSLIKASTSKTFDPLCQNKLAFSASNSDHVAPNTSRQSRPAAFSNCPKSIRAESAGPSAPIGAPTRHPDIKGFRAAALQPAATARPHRRPFRPITFSCCTACYLGDQTSPPSFQRETETETPPDLRFAHIGPAAPLRGHVTPSGVWRCCTTTEGVWLRRHGDARL